MRLENLMISVGFGVFTEGIAVHSETDLVNGTFQVIHTWMN